MRLDSSESLIGGSAAMQRLRTLVPRIAGSDSGVLLIGEPGSGREHVARLLHELGPRAGGRFAVVGCPGYAAQDDFDELFGGEGRPGMLEECAGGTLYLAAIDELPPAVQGKLSRFVEDASYGTVAKPRLLASARHDLGRLVAMGRFRGDLFYRLSVVTLRLPPLRDRREDIPALATHFLRVAATSLGKHFTGISEPALEALAAHRWHGNLAELAAAIQRAAIIESTDLLTVESLPPAVLSGQRMAATG